MYTKDPRKRLADAGLVVLTGALMVWGLTGCATPAEDAKPVKAPVAGKSGKGKSTKVKKAKPARTVWSDGMYKVPDEIKPGVYETEGSADGCGWERLKDSSGDFNAIITNDLFQGPGKITVKPSDAYVKFSLGCDWKRAA